MMALKCSITHLVAGLRQSDINIANKTSNVIIVELKFTTVLKIMKTSTISTNGKMFSVSEIPKIDGF